MFQTDPPRRTSGLFSRFWPHLLTLAVVFAFAWLAYSSSSEAPLLFDNKRAIADDSRVHAATAVHLKQILTLQYWVGAPDGLYRPVTTLSYLFNYAVLGGGESPFGYHAVNLLLHLLNIGLVYALGLLIFGETAAGSGAGDDNRRLLKRERHCCHRRAAGGLFRSGLRT